MAARVDTRREPHADGPVLHVTLCNAARLNILDSPLIAALTDAFAAAAQDDTLHAVVLAGEGPRAFIGGADINEMAGLAPDTARAFITRLHRLCAAIRALDIPVVARLQGWTLGAGLEVAAACDLRIAAAGARFGMPEVRMGIPSVIEAALLPPLIGWGRTRRLLLTGETIDAATALAWGLVEETVPDADLDAAIARLLDSLRAGAPRAMRLQKALIRQWEALPPDAAIAAGIDSFAEAWTTKEPATRMAAFLATKRRS